MRPGFETGHNVDNINIEAGLQELKKCGYEDPKTFMVIEYALMRWARGEENKAEKGAIDSLFHGISFTCWRRVLAAAIAAAEEQWYQRTCDELPPEQLDRFIRLVQQLAAKG